MHCQHRQKTADIFAIQRQLKILPFNDVLLCTHVCLKCLWRYNIGEGDSSYSWLVDVTKRKIHHHRCHHCTSSSLSCTCMVCSYKSYKNNATQLSLKVLTVKWKFEQLWCQISTDLSMRISWARVTVEVCFMLGVRQQKKHGLQV